MRRFLLILFFAFIFIIRGEEYKIGPGDVIQIIVWKQPDFSHTLTVSPSGTIYYPFLGKIKVAGLTLEEVEKIIKEKLSKEYIKNPKVGVILKECNSRKIFIFGEVTNPGVYKILNKTPILEILFKAGGLTKKAGKFLLINRKKKDKNLSKTETIKVNLEKLLVKGDLSQNVMVQPGDIIYVAPKEEKIIYVLGEVENPGPYKIEGDVTVLEAIRMAGGFTPSAAKHRIEVLREENGKKKRIRVNVVEIERKGKLEQDILLKPGDIITVPESWF